MKTPVRFLLPALTAALLIPAAARADESAPAARRERDRRVVVIAGEGDEGGEHGSMKRKMRVMRIHGRPMLGLMVGGRPGDDAKDGAPILAVTPGGPAAEAGLKAGDVIVAVNGKSLRDLAAAQPRAEGAEEEDDDAMPGPQMALIRFSGTLKAGDKVVVDYRRGGGTQKATLTAREVKGGRTRVITRVGPDGKSTTRVMNDDEADEDEEGPGDRDIMIELPEIPEIPEMPEMPGMVWHRFPGAFAGLELTAINPDLGDYFGATKGLLVTKAPANSELKAGDVLLKIGDREPQSPAQAMRILRSYEAGESVRVELLRRRSAQTVTLKIPAEADEDGDDDATPAPAPVAPRPPRPAKPARAPRAPTPAPAPIPVAASSPSATA